MVAKLGKINGIKLQIGKKKLTFAAAKAKWVSPIRPAPCESSRA
jgi:hypothetical protein